MTHPLETDAGLVKRLRNCAATRNTGRFVAPLDHETMGYYGVGNTQLDNEAAIRIESLTAELKQERSIALSHMSSRKLWEFAAKENMERAIAAEARLATIEAETRADERERCAKIADEFGGRDNAKARSARLVATAIRNKGI